MKDVLLGNAEGGRRRKSSPATLEGVAIKQEPERIPLTWPLSFVKKVMQLSNTTKTGVLEMLRSHGVNVRGRLVHVSDPEALRRI